MRGDLVDLVELLTTLRLVREAQAAHPELVELAAARAEVVAELRQHLAPRAR